MSKIKLNKALKKIIENKKSIKPICTEAEIDTGDGFIQLNTNGVPSLISIQFNGSVAFENMMPVYFKVISSPQRIIINNLFKKNVPKVLFSYIGEVEILNCSIISQDGSRIAVSVKNSNNLDLANKSKTNFEDDTMILFEEESLYKKPKIKQYGVAPRLIKPSFNSQGKVQKYGKIEAENISSIITEVSPSIAPLPKGKVSMPMSAKSLTKIKPIIKDKVRYGDVQGNFKKYRK